jgi:hypothetical protein
MNDSDHPALSFAGWELPHVDTESAFVNHGWIADGLASHNGVDYRFAREYILVYHFLSQTFFHQVKIYRSPAVFIFQELCRCRTASASLFEDESSLSELIHQSTVFYSVEDLRARIKAAAQV